jgi:hypothetical protein
MDFLLHISGLDGGGTRGRFVNLKLRRKLDDYMSNFGPRRIRGDNIMAAFSSNGMISTFSK